MIDKFEKPTAIAVLGYIIANWALNISLSVSMALIWSMINSL